jgi:hypothetical protein
MSDQGDTDDQGQQPDQTPGDEVAPEPGTGDAGTGEPAAPAEHEAEPEAGDDVTDRDADDDDGEKESVIAPHMW